MSYLEERFKSVKLWFVLETISLRSSQTESALDQGSSVFLRHIG